MSHLDGNPFSIPQVDGGGYDDDEDYAAVEEVSTSSESDLSEEGSGDEEVSINLPPKNLTTKPKQIESPLRRVTRQQGIKKPLKVGRPKRIQAKDEGQSPRSLRGFVSKNIKTKDVEDKETNSKFLCKNCKKGFSTKTSLGSHMYWCDPLRITRSRTGEVRKQSKPNNSTTKNPSTKSKRAQKIENQSKANINEKTHEIPGPSQLQYNSDFKQKYSDPTVTKEHLSDQGNQDDSTDESDYETKLTFASEILPNGKEELKSDEQTDNNPASCPKCRMTYRNIESLQKHVNTCTYLSSSSSEEDDEKSDEERKLMKGQLNFSLPEPQHSSEIVNEIWSKDPTHFHDHILSQEVSSLNIHGCLKEEVTKTEPILTDHVTHVSSVVLNLSEKSNDLILSTPDSSHKFPLKSSTEAAPTTLEFGYTITEANNTEISRIANAVTYAQNYQPEDRLEKMFLSVSAPLTAVTNTVNSVPSRSYGLSSLNPTQLSHVLANDQQHLQNSEKSGSSVSVGVVGSNFHLSSAIKNTSIVPQSEGIVSILPSALEIPTSIPIQYKNTNNFSDANTKTNEFGQYTYPSQVTARSIESDQRYLPYSNAVRLTTSNCPSLNLNSNLLQPTLDAVQGSHHDSSLPNINERQLSNEYVLPNSNIPAVPNLSGQPGSFYQAQAHASNVSEYVMPQQQHRLAQPTPVNNSQAVYYQDTTNGQVYRMNVPTQAQNSAYQPQTSFSSNRLDTVIPVNHPHYSQQMLQLALSQQVSEGHKLSSQQPHTIQQHSQQLQLPQALLQQQRATQLNMHHQQLSQLHTQPQPQQPSQDLLQLQHSQTHLDQLQNPQTHMNMHQQYASRAVVHLQQPQPSQSHLPEPNSQSHLQQQSSQSHLLQLQSSQSYLQQQPSQTNIVQQNQPPHSHFQLHQPSQSHLQQQQPSQAHLQQLQPPPVNLQQLRQPPQTPEQHSHLPQTRFLSEINKINLNLLQRVPSEGQAQQPFHMPHHLEVLPEESHSQLQLSLQNQQALESNQELTQFQQVHMQTSGDRHASLPVFRQPMPISSQIRYGQLQSHGIKPTSHPQSTQPQDPCHSIVQRLQESSSAPACTSMRRNCNESNQHLIMNPYSAHQSLSLDQDPSRTGIVPNRDIVQTIGNQINQNQQYQMIQMPDGTTYIVVQPENIQLNTNNPPTPIESTLGEVHQLQKNTEQLNPSGAAFSMASPSNQNLINNCLSTVGHLNFTGNGDQSFICTSNANQSQPCPCPRCSLRVTANTVADKYRKVLPFPRPIEPKMTPRDGTSSSIEASPGSIKTYMGRSLNKSVKRQLASMIMEKQSSNSNVAQTTDITSEGGEAFENTSSVQASRKNPVLTAVVRPMEHPLQKMSDQISQIEFSFNASSPIPTAQPLSGPIQGPETSISLRKDSPVSGNSNISIQVTTASVATHMPTVAVAGGNFALEMGSDVIESSNNPISMIDESLENQICGPSVDSVIQAPTTPTRVAAKRKIEQIVDGSPAKSIKVTLRRKEGGDSYSIKDVSETGASATGAMRSLKIKGKITSGEYAGTSTDVVVEPRIHIVPIPNPDSEDLDSNLTIAADSPNNSPVDTSIPIGNPCEEKSDTTSSQRLTHRAVVVYEVKDSNTVLFRSSDVRAVWSHIFETVQGTRLNHNLPPLSYPATNISLSENQKEPTTTFNMLGLTHRAVQFLLHHLPKKKPDVEKQRFRLVEPPVPVKDDNDVDINESGCARIEGYTGRKPFDMFGWLASKHRKPLEKIQTSDEGLKNNGIPIALRFRNLKEKTEKTLTVLWSTIHGRGLYTRRSIEKGEMIIEYAGEVIRSLVCDQREEYYETKGIGCYMFRINDDSVIDATMKGNAARFINHSCDPNCESKTMKILGMEKILILALRKISSGEELTYDYKFDKEEVKIPCSCASKKCRKYLN